MSINSTMILFCLFCICRIKSGSVIQTKHFDIKMSLEIRQAKSFFFTLFGYVFLHLFILHITINCNYLFTKHFKYKTLIYLCQRPPPEKFVVFYLYKRWRGRNGYALLQMLFGDAVVSAWLGYSISQMLFLMRRYLQEWDIRCCGCFFPATHV